MIDNVVVPVASGYGLSEEYRYLKSSIREFLTGLFPSEFFYQIRLFIGFLRCVVSPVSSLYLRYIERLTLCCSVAIE